MLHDFEYCIYTKFVFGHDAHKKVGEELKKMHVKKVLLHHDNAKFLHDFGILPDIENSLKSVGIDFVHFGGVEPNPIVQVVREGIKVCRNEQIDFILAIGGGSAIDSAKAIALGVPYQGDVWDFFVKKAIPQDRLSVGAVLTIPAAGSESSETTVITDKTLHAKQSYADAFNRPKIAFMNPSLSCTLPAHMSACGMADIFSHVTERYMTPDTHFGVMDYMCEGVLKCMLETAPKVMEAPEDYVNRAEVMWMGSLGTNNMIGLGRARDWASHTIAHQLSAFYNMIHGETLSIIMPAWMRYVYKENLPRFVRYAVEVYGVENDLNNQEKVALAGIECCKNFFKSLGMPTSLTEVGIPTDKLREMSAAAIESRNGKPIGSIKELTAEDVYNIYMLAV